MPRTKSKVKTRSKSHQKKALATRKRINKLNASKRRAVTKKKRPAKRKASARTRK